MRAAISIDYLTFRVMDMGLVEVITSVLGMAFDGFELINGGLNRYKKTARYGNIKVLYGGKENMGICVTMTGQACREYEFYHGENGGGIMLLVECIAQADNINITRLDIACDDFAGALCMDAIIYHADNGLVRTRSTSHTRHESFKGSEKAGMSVYFGSSHSPFRLRIYDKSRQMYDADDPRYSEPWIRMELQLRHEYAEQAGALLVTNNNLGAAVAGLISDKINFITLDDSNISRCSLADWWQEFLGDIEDVSLISSPKTTHDIDTHLDWLKTSCSRIIAKVIDAVGQERFDREITAYGKFRLTQSDLLSIEHYKKILEKGKR